MMVKRRALPSANKPPPTDNPNHLLAALPAADDSRTLPSLAIVPLELKDTLHKPLEAASCECYRAATDLRQRATDGRKS